MLSSWSSVQFAPIVARSESVHLLLSCSRVRREDRQRPRDNEMLHWLVIVLQGHCTINCSTMLQFQLLSLLPADTELDYLSRDILRRTLHLENPRPHKSGQVYCC